MPRPVSSHESVADDSYLAQYAQTYRFRAGRPAAIKITPKADAVLFLRSGPRDRVRNLYVYDVAAAQERVLLTAEQILQGVEEKLSAAEKARRERMRMTARGIASYELSKDGQRILVPLSGRLFVVDRADGSVVELPQGAFPVDARFSPNGRKVACVREGDLYVIDITTKRQIRLTKKGPHQSNGDAEFVAQEEMGRYHGYWWSPDSKSIAFQQTDTSGMEVMHIVDPAHPEKAAQSWPYPRPGQKNAKVRLGIISAKGGKTKWVDWDNAAYPYLVQVRWDKGAPLTAVVQNRLQSEILLLEIDPKNAKTSTLHSERDAAWVNIDADMPKWQVHEGTASFLWTTERQGYWQLERRDRRGQLLQALTSVDIGLRKVLSVDAKSDETYALASMDPTQTHLVRLSGASKQPEILTKVDGEHSAVVAKHHDLIVVSENNRQGKRRYVVMRPDASVVGEIANRSEAPNFTPEVEWFTVGERQLRAVVIRPRNFVAGSMYPVIVSVYGGPHARMVGAARQRYAMSQWIADHGFIVVSIDGRGTPGRGRAWERSMHGSFSAVQLADQIEGLAGLAAKVPEMDTARVGIYGWSYGGYMSAMAVLEHPQTFHAAVAGAPVTDWKLYDTHYTERYVGLPKKDADDNYTRSSAIAKATQLDRPLLLIHGTADDNVYFSHSVLLSDALFKAGKDHELLPLVGFTHMVPDPVVTQRLYSRIVQFFQRHL